MLSISLCCSPEKHAFVVQTEFYEMLGTEFDFFRPFLTGIFPEAEKWKVEGGTFQGKWMAWFDKSKLSHLEFERSPRQRDRFDNS